MELDSFNIQECVDSRDLYVTLYSTVEVYRLQRSPLAGRGLLTPGSGALTPAEPSLPALGSSCAARSPFVERESSPKDSSGFHAPRHLSHFQVRDLGPEKSNKLMQGYLDSTQRGGAQGHVCRTP